MTDSKNTNEDDTSQSEKNNDFPTYKKRSGTNDLGKEFEYTMLALYTLKLISNEEVLDFQMTSNNVIYGDFDDLSLEIKFKDHTSTFLLQLKHKESKEKSITNKYLISPGNDYSLLKYMKSFEQLDEQNVYCLIYTNLSSKLKNNAKFSMKLIEKKNDQKQEETDFDVTVKSGNCLPHLDLLQNCKSQPQNSNIFRFEITQEKPKFKRLDQYCRKVFLLTGQDNINTVKSTVKEMLKKFVEIDIYDLFISFTKEAWSGRYFITKQDVVVKMVELALSPWIRVVSSDKRNDKTELVSRVIMDHDITIIRSGNSVIDKIWSCDYFQEEFWKAAHKYNIDCEDLTLNKQTRILWLLNKVPLIVEVDRQHIDIVKLAVDLLTNNPDKRKLVLVSDVHKEQFNRSGILESLEDCRLHREVFSNLKIKIQGKESLHLEDLIDNIPDVQSFIKIDDLLEMTQNDCLEVGRFVEALPEFYIPRRVSSTLLNTEKFLDQLRHEDNYIVIVNCQKNFEDRFKVKNFRTMTLESFLISEKQNDLKNLILLSTDRPCTVFQYESVFKLKNRNVYLIEKSNDDFCILLKSKKEKPNMTEELLIREEEIFVVLRTRLNIVVASPGMGKSTLCEALQRNCPPLSWAVLVKLIQHNSFLEKKPDFDQMLAHFLSHENVEPIEKEMAEAFRKHRKLFIFLDGLDEVESRSVNQVVDFAEECLSRGFNVWIFSRENLKEMLTTRLNSVLVDLVELDETEQRHYIENRLRIKYDRREISKIIDVISQSSDVVNGRKLMGIPLQLHIITENFLKDDDLLADLDQQNVFVVTKMYQLFFEGKWKFKDEKTGASKMQEQTGLWFKSHLRLYEIPALEICFDDDTFRKLRIGSCDYDDSREFLRELRKTGDKFGIIGSISEESRAVFAHQTFAEYFACVWLGRNSEKLTLIRDSWFNENYDNLRHFFDIFLCEKSSLHLAVIYSDINYFRNNVANFQNIKDVAGRDAFYVACCFGRKYPSPDENDFFASYHRCYIKKETETYTGMVEVLLNYVDDLFQEDDLLRLNYIEYALGSRCLYVIEAVLKTKKLSFENLDKLINARYDYKTLAFYGALLNYPTLLNETLRQCDAFFPIHYPSYRFGNSDLLTVVIQGSEDDGSTGVKRESVEAAEVIISHYVEKGVINDILQNGRHFKTACRLGSYEIIKIISTYIHDHTRQIILHLTANYGTLNTSIIDLSKELNVEINATDGNGRTPLQLACESCHCDCVKVLIENGADLGILDGDGNNILHCASKGHQETTEIMKLIFDLAPNVDVNAKNKNGQISLHLACRKGVAANVKLLLDKGANARAICNEGNSPLHYLSGCGDVETLQLLIDRNVNVNLQNKNGDTALHLKLEQTHYTHKSFFAEALLRNGADPCITDSNGRNCLDVAFERGIWGTLRLVVEWRENFFIDLISPSIVLRYCVYGGCCSGTEYIVNNVNLEELDLSNVKLPLDFLQVDGLVQGELLGKMTKYVRLIQDIEYIAPHPYDPDKIVKYIKYQISQNRNVSSIFDDDPDTYFAWRKLYEKQLTDAIRNARIRLHNRGHRYNFFL